MSQAPEWFLVIGFILYSGVVLLMGFAMGYARGQDETEARWSEATTRGEYYRKYPSTANIVQGEIVRGRPPDG